jgi:hypothetical protein
MSINSRKIGRFLLTAGLLAIIAQGLWLLPDLQDHFVPDKYWELKVESANKEDWHIDQGLTSLRLRVGYLEWSLAHRDLPHSFSVDWMLHFPISEFIRWVSPKFCWNINIYLANKTRVGVQRKLKNLEALFANIQLTKKQSLLLVGKNEWLNEKQFEERFKLYNGELIKLKNQLDQIINNFQQKAHFY